MLAAALSAPNDPAAAPHRPLHALAGERLLTFPAAAREVPSRAGGFACASTVWRWSEFGVRTATGRVKLERVRLGATWWTSAEALARFFAALSAPASLDGGAGGCGRPDGLGRSREVEPVGD